MTYRELVYMVMDLLKLASDDSYYTEEHVVFMLKRYRAALLYLKYIQQKLIEELREQNEQEICLNLELAPESATNCGEVMLKSTEKLPKLLEESTLRIELENQFRGDINFVSPRRFKHVGFNRFLQGLIYATKTGNNYLYMKSDNPDLQYLDKIKVTAVFDDPEEAAKYSCDEESSEDNASCSIMDKEFPIDDSLSAQLIQSVVAALSSSTQSPMDDSNNAMDDLSALAYFIRRNMKNEYQRKLQNN